MVTKKLEEIMSYIEPLLERCAYTEEDDDENGQKAAVPEITKANLSRRKSNREMLSLDVPVEAKQKIETVLEYSQYDTDSGLEEELMNRAHRYLYDQALCVREVDHMRLSKRLSSVTTESDILKYMSYFDKESVAADMDAITFMATDRASSKPFGYIERNFSCIRDIKNRFDQTKAALIADTINDVQSSGRIDDLGNAIDLQCRGMHPVNSDDYCRNTEAVLSTNEEYVGFLQTGPDIYTKISNPHFVCNQRAAASYAKYQKTGVA